MRRFVLPGLLLGLLATFAVWAEPVVFVDSRLMVLAHPITQRFDPVARRFFDTSSEHVLGGMEGMQGLEGERTDLQRQLDGLTPEYARRMSGTGTSERKRLEKELLQKRREIQSRIEMLQKRKEEARSVPEQPGMTSGRSILPQVQEIVDAIRQALQQIQIQRKASVVIDIAPLLPGAVLNIDTAMLFTNRHFGFWRGTAAPTGENLEWIRNARSFLFQEGKTLPPVVYGAGDARIDALNLVQQLGERK